MSEAKKDGPAMPPKPKKPRTSPLKEKLSEKREQEIHEEVKKDREAQKAWAEAEATKPGAKPRFYSDEQMTLISAASGAASAGHRCLDVAAIRGGDSEEFNLARAECFLRNAYDAIRDARREAP